MKQRFSRSYSLSGNGGEVMPFKRVACFRYKASMPTPILS
jgi:hypothetical protein